VAKQAQQKAMSKKDYALWVKQQKDAKHNQ
jgi:hypothetical protein